MNQKGLLNIVLTIIIVILLGAVGYFALVKKPAPAPTAPIPELTKETALQLLKDVLFDSECHAEKVVGKYNSCAVDISKTGNDSWTVAVTYDGLYDDSVKAAKTQATFVYQNGQWVRQNISKTQQCWQGRGHQDFSTETCV